MIPIGTKVKLFSEDQISILDLNLVEDRECLGKVVTIVSAVPRECYYKYTYSVNYNGNVSRIPCSVIKVAYMRPKLNIGSKVTIIRSLNGKSPSDYPGVFIRAKQHWFGFSSEVVAYTTRFADYTESQKRLFSKELLDGFRYKLADTGDFWWTLPMFEKFDIKPTKIKVPDHKISINLC